MGESGRSIYHRQVAHKRAIRNGDMNNALFVHMLENNHIIDWDGLDMIYNENSIKRRKVIEWDLINFVSTMNLSDGCYKLDNVITRHVLRAANFVGAVERLNGLGAVTYSAF